MDLFKQIIGGQITLVMENGDGQKAHLEHRFSKPAEKQRTEEDKFVVGGSAFGWNFITVPSSESFYYGVTKETFRASQEINYENDSGHEQVPSAERCC